MAVENWELDVEEAMEGETVLSRNYRFIQIGQPIPINKPTHHSSLLYDSQNPPSLPLAVSQRFRLLFVAHSEGFYVARTKEVIAAAERNKENGSDSFDGPKSIHDLSFINPPIGKVSILALSSDDSWLAASIHNRIHFFTLSALLHKEQEPSFSIYIEKTSFIKDIKWARKPEKDYVALSNNGKLYRGFGQDSLVNHLVDVDAVEWSIKGDFVAVARKNVLSIMSSLFKEKHNFSLSPTSLIVDSIRWVRADTIVLGCFVFGDDSEQATYLVLVITTQDKDIAYASSGPAVLSFNDMFLDYQCDVVACASGPNLFLSYLDYHEIAFIANRRNLSQHVVLVGWSLGDTEIGAMMIEVSNDAWCAHIESQGNGDDNLILALSVDKVSQNEEIKFILGEEEAEVAPCCVLLCVTVDGKLSLFHFASAAGAVGSPDAFTDSNVQENICSQLLSKHGLSGISSEVTEQNERYSSVASESDESSRVEPSKIQGNNVGWASMHNISCPSISKNKPQEESIFGTQEHSPVVLQTPKGGNEKAFSSTKLKQDRGTLPSESDRNTDLKSEHSHLRNFHSSFPGTKAINFHKTDDNSISESKPVDSLPGKVSTDLFTRSESRSSQNFGSPEFQDGVSDRSTLNTVATLFQSPHTKESFGPSVRICSSVPRAVTMMGDSGSSDSQVLSQENFVTGKSSVPRRSKGNLVTTSQPQRSSYEQKLSAQFSNVEVQAKEMDRLLEGIGGEGGFRDASITSQKGSVAALEDGLWTISERCRMWRGILEEQLRETQLLLDKTVQVFSSKTFMKDILLKATDNQYSDLWNCQKLSSELELERQHILEVHQELASQLVQLERHFNTIELNSFGGSGSVQKTQKAIQNGHGKLRQQSYKSLQNTMGAQLAAAEKLSESLRKQMATLSLDCRATKQNVKWELFETLGLKCDGASYNSSGSQKASDTPTKELMIASSSITAEKQSGRNLSTPGKCSEQQTVRRQRDSLDQKWPSSDPLKTTVRRMLLQSSADGSSVGMKKEHLKFQLLGESASFRSGLYDVNAKETAKKSIERLSTPLYQSADGFADFGMKDVPVPSLPELSRQLTSTASAGLDGAGENRTLLKESGIFSPPSKSLELSVSDSRNVRQSAVSPSDASTGTEKIPAFCMTSFKSSSDSPNFSSEEFGPSRSAIREIKQTPITSENFASDSSSSYKASVSPSPMHSIGSMGKISVNKNLPGGAMMASQVMQPSVTSQVSLSTLSSSSSETSAESKSLATFSGNVSSSSHTKIDGEQKVWQSHPFVSSSSSSTSTLPFVSPQKDNLSSMAPTLISESAESLESGSQPLLSVIDLKKDGISLQPTMVLSSSLTVGETLKAEASVSQPGLFSGRSGSIIGSEIQSTPKTELPGILNSENEHNINSMVSPVSEMLPSKVEQPWPSGNDSPPAVLFSGTSPIGKDGSSAVNDEDEMEEEAPEDSQTTELALGNFGGFGFGSTSTSTAVKPNPFGANVLNKTAAPINPPLAMPNPTGKLFRPASFNFQSMLPSQPLITANNSALPSGFSTGSSSLVPTSSGFGQPAQFGSGQQALGSVLGAFGQSRQLGAIPHATSIATPSGFGGGLDGMPSGGFEGGFPSVASASGGFANSAGGGGGGGGGGFAAAAMARGGFAAAAAAAATATAGAGYASGGFGGFVNQVGGGFSTFASSSGAGSVPSELFTKMRK